MQPISNQLLISKLEHVVEKHLHFAIHDLQNLTEQELLKPSESGGWSVAQCLEHLNRYGFYYLPILERGLKTSSVMSGDITFQSTWLGRYFIRMLDPETGKKKIKAFRDYIPSSNLDSHAVVATFISHQEKLLLLLREAQNRDLNRIKVPVSIAKWIRLRAGDVFQFLVAHNERHVRQAKRNLDQSRISIAYKVPFSETMN